MTLNYQNFFYLDILVKLNYCNVEFMKKEIQVTQIHHNLHINIEPIRHQMSNKYKNVTRIFKVLSI